MTALKLLNNNFIRFLVCLVSGTNLLLFLYSNNFECAGVFILSAIVASFYSKYMVVILIVAMVVCNIACTTHSQMDGFKMKKKIKKQKSKLKSKPEESEGVDDTGGTGTGAGTGTGTSGSGTGSGSGTDTTLSQNIATILSEVQRIKKELTT